MSFASKYGPWALVAGASEGLGAAYATELAARGLNIVLVARRREPLGLVAAGLPTQTMTVVADLATPEGIAAVKAVTSTVEVGLVIANAAYSSIGAFVDLDIDRARTAIGVNCQAPVELAHHFLPLMARRGRGGMVVMSSLAGMQGTPPITVYAATKAFGAVLAEGLWAEMRPRGVDVVACVAGAIATPNLAGSMAKPAPGTLPPERVVRVALKGLGRGPRVTPGATVRFSTFLLGRLLPKRAAIAIVSRSSRDVQAPT